MPLMVALPVAGLTSLQPFDEVEAKLENTRLNHHDLGCTLPEPLHTMVFLPPPVIPQMKVTDFGYSIVDKFGFVETGLMA